MTPQEQFKKYAELWMENDSSNVVPIIGSGVNIQAERLEGKGQVLNWDTLIKDIISDLSFSKVNLPKELPNSFLRKWETVLRVVALNTRGTGPAIAEKDLQRKVQNILGEYENRCKEYGLYKTILDGQFKDIISLNFDRCLSLAGGTKSIQSIPTYLDKKLSKDNATLFRNSLIKADKNDTRIWYPHGDTKRYDTIKLGIRKYGIYINWIESLRGEYMSQWYERDSIYRQRNNVHWIPPEEWDSIVRKYAQNTSWVNVFKSAPLLFIGCSLLPDEWPLWYLLNQRARQTAFLDQEGSPDDRPATVVLSAGNNRPLHLSNEPEYIVNIHFDTFDELWKSVDEFFAQCKSEQS